MDVTYQSDGMHVNENAEEYTTIYYAGFWVRFWAYLLDLLVIGSLNRIIVNPIIKLFQIAPNEPSFLPMHTVLTGVIFYLYFVLMTKYLQQTLGKMVFGIKVVAKEGAMTWLTVFIREIFGRSISKALFGLVYIWVAFAPKKQGVHDYFSDTYVIHTRK